MPSRPLRVCSHPTCSALTSGRFCHVHAIAHARQEAARQRTRSRARSSTVRRAVDDRDGRRCAICGSQVNTAKHHITPLSQGGADDPANMVTLCAEHHAAAHRAERRAATR